MVAIKVLPPEVVNRIAAGEVIERPASVVKELIENSIDAGARRIDILIEEGGRKRIRVRDDGCGIAPEDLPLAFETHTTSKLTSTFPRPQGAFPAPPAPLERPAAAFPDLFAVRTLGFRGEALASIGSVAEVEVVSRVAGSECAYRYRPPPPGGRPAAPEPAAAPSGTTIEVRNLFGAVPARRKFLRSAAAEASHVVEQVIRIALGFPRLYISLEHGSRAVLELPAARSFRERVAGILDPRQARELLDLGAADPEPVEEADGAPASREGLRIRGLVGAPHIHRPDTRSQNFFVNGRWVRDRVLAHALRSAYQGFQIPGRQPVAYLFIELPPDQVDINVHPQKTEVRFLNSQAVHRSVEGAVRAALEEAGLKTAGAPGAAPAGLLEDCDRIRQAAADFFAGPRRDEERQRRFASERGAGGRMETGSRPAAPAPQSGGAAGSGAHGPPGLPPVRPGSAVQLLREFIVAEAGNGILVIDQHALHEKVLYERIIRRLQEGQVPAQRLLLPEVVELPPELAPLAPAVITELQPFGFEVEPFGEREVAVQAVPALLDRGPAADVVRAVAEWLRARPGAAETGAAAGVIGENLRRIAQIMACKQAVKAGTELGAEEVCALIRDAGEAIDPRFCPHGRPTAVLIRREDLERLFDRK